MPRTVRLVLACLLVAPLGAAAVQVTVQVDDALVADVVRQYQLAPDGFAAWVQGRVQALVGQVARDQAQAQVGGLLDALQQAPAGVRQQAIWAAHRAMEGAPGAGARPPPSVSREELTPTLLSFGGLGVVAGWLWSGGSWLAEVMGVWLLGYLLWEMRPLRRLLFGVVRRLYPRSLED